MVSVLNPHFTANQGGYSRDRAAAVYDRMRSTSAMVLEDGEMCRVVLQRGGTPILRIRVPQDDDGDAHLDPVEYVDTIHAQLTEAERDIPGAALKGRVHIGNELGSTQPKRLDAWLEAGIRRASFHKRRACAANWSVFNPDPKLHAELTKTYAAIRANLGEMGSHEGGLGTVGVVIRTVADAIRLGAIGGYRAAMKQYGFRVRITEFAASLTPEDGYGSWMSDDEFAQFCDDAARYYAFDGVAVHIFTAFKWDRGRNFEYADKPLLQSDFASTNIRYPVKDIPVTPTPPPPTFPLPETLGDPQLATVSAVANVFSHIRQQPTSSALSIRTVKPGDVIMVRPRTTDLGGAYTVNGVKMTTWHALDVGWLAAGVVTLAVGAPDAPVVELNVPYYSQIDADSDKRANDCGLACARMIIGYQFKRVGLTDPKLITVNKLVADSTLATVDKPLPLSEIERVLDGYGVSVDYKRPLTPDAIASELDNGRPPLVLVNYKHINKNQLTDMGHYVVVRAYGERSYWIHDPYLLGANVQISREQLDKAMTDLGDAASFDYQGLSLAA